MSYVPPAFISKHWKTHAKFDLFVSRVCNFFFFLVIMYFCSSHFAVQFAAVTLCCHRIEMGKIEGDVDTYRRRDLVVFHINYNIIVYRQFGGIFNGRTYDNAY